LTPIDPPATLVDVDDSVRTFVIAFLMILPLSFGVRLLFLGVRGTAEPVAPCCNRCGHLLPVPFDPQASDSLALRPCRCLECGTDLADPGTIRIARRRWRGRTIVAGLLVWALSLTVPFAHTAIVTPGSRRTTAMSPEAVMALIESAEAGDQIDLCGFASQIASGKVSDEHLRGVAAAMARRARRGDRRVFATCEADILLAADARGLLASEDLMELADSAVQPVQIDLLQHRREGEALPLSPRAYPLLGWARVDLFITGFSLDGTPYPLLKRSTGRVPSKETIAPEAGVLESIDAVLGGKVRLDVPPGTYTARVEVERRYWVARPNRTLSLPMQEAPDARRTERIEWSLTIVAPDAPSWVRLESPAELASDVAASCHVLKVALDADASGSICRLDAEIDIQSQVKCSLAFDVFVTLEGREWLVGSYGVARLRDWSQEVGATHPVEVPCPSLPLPATVEVTFRPQPRLIEILGDVPSIWGSPVVKRGVPLSVSGFDNDVHRGKSDGGLR
jgi:hypothetical protein